MPARQRVRRHDSLEIQGEQSWVEIAYMTYREAEELRAAVNALQANGHTEDEQAAEMTRQMLARYVRAWNWVDDNGDPLPQPHDNPDVFKELLISEINFISSKMGGNTDEKKGSSRR